MPVCMQHSDYHHQGMGGVWSHSWNAVYMHCPGHLQKNRPGIYECICSDSVTYFQTYVNNTGRSPVLFCFVFFRFFSGYGFVCANSGYEALPTDVILCVPSPMGDDTVTIVTAQVTNVRLML